MNTQQAHTPTRCPWCGSDPLYMAYHDLEWGKPIYDSDVLFALLCLESMQAGLSWITVLKKRQHLYDAFDNFDAHIIANYDDTKIDKLMADASIIRNHKKIIAIIHNARAYLSLSQSLAPAQSFADWLWAITTDGTPVINHPTSPADIPTRTAVSDRLAAALKAQGFKFLGSVTCYAFMQACGMVNDHLVSCDFRFGAKPTTISYKDVHESPDIHQSST